MKVLKRKSIIPGFGITLGFTVFYLSLMVLIPLSSLFIKTASLSFSQFWEIILSPRVFASFRLSLMASLVAAAINLIFGLIVAWVLVRYEFRGKKIIDALVDLPFALPTAVAGISLTAIYSPNSFLGQILGVLGVQVAFTELGVIVALTFISLPFVIRTVQPVLEDMSTDLEEAAASLGAGRLITFTQIILPNLKPALLTGLALAFARALGEYGSVVFISGNMPFKTEIIPLLIMTKLEQYDYVGANAIAVMSLLLSFLILIVVNILQRNTNRKD
jgi:sulfate transport system permease protein